MTIKDLEKSYERHDRLWSYTKPGFKYGLVKSRTHKPRQGFDDEITYCFNSMDVLLLTSATSCRLC